MKTLKNSMKEYLQRIYVLTQRFSTPKRFYIYVNNRIKEKTLKKITELLRIAENHKYYNSLLKILVPDWNVKIQEAKFIGKGYGSRNLNTYRKVKIGNKNYFEKIHFSRYQNLDTEQWFQENIYQLIRDKINVPLIHKIYQGPILSIVYYDFWELSVLEKETVENTLIQFSKDLYYISCRSQPMLTTLEIPEAIKDFRLHFRYQQSRVLAEAKLLKHEINMRALEDSIDRSKHILTHGDINPGNGFQNRVLIDWGSFCFFPIGFEAAHIFYRIQFRYIQLTDVITWLQRHYKSTVLKEDWKSCKRNFIYFLFVFFTKQFERGELKKLEQQLIAKLKQSSKLLRRNSLHQLPYYS
jgi:hypothetical protein